MISIVTGTLNRCNLLPNLINNTIDKNDKLELVLVDGGSTDGTIEYIKELNNPNIKFIEVGGRSSYPHFMNLGIVNSKYDIICQWNDDVILINKWDEVLNEIDNVHDFYLFNWKYGHIEDISKPEWLAGSDHTKGWCLLDDTTKNGENVMNYGLYKKKIFNKIGLYNNAYQYYYADGDMAYRANKFGYKHKSLRNIKVCSIPINKQAQHHHNDENTYRENLNLYNNGILPNTLNFL